MGVPVPKPQRTALVVLALLVACGPPLPTPDRPDDGFVQIRGARLAYRVMGDGAGAPALFIHGGPGSTSCDFVYAMRGLLETRPVVLYDQVGSGYSSRIPAEQLDDFTDFDRFLEEIDALRAELDLSELHLVGSSWGSAVALEYLLEGNAQGVLSVTFAGPYFSTERWIDDTDRLVASLSESSRDAIAAAVASGEFDTQAFQDANTEFMANYGIRTPLDQIDWVDCDFQPSGNSGLYEHMWGPSEFVSTGLLRDYDRIERLTELELPTLFLIGEFDEPSPETVAEYQSMVTGSQVEIIPEAGHASYVDQPEIFNEVLTRFLSSVEAR